MRIPNPRVVVIGAGMGGLASAIRLAAQGAQVTLIEAAGTPGGKMRTLPSPAGPVDAGPTVLTMRHHFDALFETAGQRMNDAVELCREPLLARHWWPDGTTLDLTDDPAQNATAIERAFDRAEAQAFLKFDRESRVLFNTFELAMMETAEPKLRSLALAAVKNPEVLPTLMPPKSMATALRRRFRTLHLRQLFGRYATYVGGTPGKAPAVLQLIWQAERSGVWRVIGGMHKLATALADLAERIGVTQIYNAPIVRIEAQNGRVAAAHTLDGKRHVAEAIVFNGDPRALGMGLLGPVAQRALSIQHTEPRSLSARVWSFAAKTDKPDLAHHNVFFGTDPDQEFGPISDGQPPIDPTLYLCAQDRGSDRPVPGGLERFEIIENAAPMEHLEEGEKDACRTRIFTRLAQYGLTFSPPPEETALTTPSEFNALFPGSLGSLYGQSPDSAMAALRRPTARTRIPGLYLAGGGAHPGAGIAMAALSGRHAAEAIAKDLALPSMCRPTATHGGTSTVSAIAVTTPSRSLPS